MKLKIILLIGCLVILNASVFSAESEQKQTTDKATTTEKVQKAEQYVISYLHLNRRCSTCKKLEAYSEEAISSAFEKELADSTFIWKSVNFEEEENKHLGITYQLYSQSLVISKLENGKETDWKNLDKIWDFTDDKEKYIAYVQKTVKEFIAKSDKK